ncbi:putative phosphosugar isomerase/binding protein [Enterococcus faecium]|nr:putative phosphosugar isomerase/binding protein [Enterococcus faecium]
MSLCYFDYYHQLEEKLRIEEPLMLQAGTWIAKQINQVVDCRYMLAAH